TVISSINTAFVLPTSNGAFQNAECGVLTCSAGMTENTARKPLTNESVPCSRPENCGNSYTGLTGRTDYGKASIRIRARTADYGQGVAHLRPVPECCRYASSESGRTACATIVSS